MSTRIQYIPFRSNYIQQGNGFGSLFSTLGKFLMPAVKAIVPATKAIGKTVAKQGIATLKNPAIQKQLMNAGLEALQEGVTTFDQHRKRGRNPGNMHAMPDNVGPMPPQMMNRTPYSAFELARSRKPVKRRKTPAKKKTVVKKKTTVKRPTSYVYPLYNRKRLKKSLI